MEDKKNVVLGLNMFLSTKHTAYNISTIIK